MHRKFGYKATFLLRLTLDGVGALVLTGGDEEVIWGEVVSLIVIIIFLALVCPLTLTNSSQRARGGRDSAARLSSSGLVLGI